ncbi:hypothetical protein EJ08DRAFT_660573 [Tothia fuscella]|uniref:J domain-containing protein n=1 Tax=Tothia fuscella TaxID=1048955 RepID=A0A9P4NSW2_9PEZI|nr:hypothetical protein EJ08DRAFT_660573 [Tothia fuscella]
MSRKKQTARAIKRPLDETELMSKPLIDLDKESDYYAILGINWGTSKQGLRDACSKSNIKVKKGEAQQSLVRAVTILGNPEYKQVYDDYHKTDSASQIYRERFQDRHEWNQMMAKFKKCKKQGEDLTTQFQKHIQPQLRKSIQTSSTEVISQRWRATKTCSMSTSLLSPNISLNILVTLTWRARQQKKFERVRQSIVDIDQEYDALHDKFAIFKKQLATSFLLSNKLAGSSSSRDLENVFDKVVMSFSSELKAIKDEFEDDLLELPFVSGTSKVLSEPSWIEFNPRLHQISEKHADVQDLANWLRFRHHNKSLTQARRSIDAIQTKYIEASGVAFNQTQEDVQKGHKALSLLHQEDYELSLAMIDSLERNKSLLIAISTTPSYEILLERAEAAKNSPLADTNVYNLWVEKWKEGYTKQQGLMKLVEEKATEYEQFSKKWLGVFFNPQVEVHQEFMQYEEEKRAIHAETERWCSAAQIQHIEIQVRMTKEATEQDSSSTGEPTESSAITSEGSSTHPKVPTKSIKATIVEKDTQTSVTPESAGPNLRSNGDRKLSSSSKVVSQAITSSSSRTPRQASQAPVRHSTGEGCASGPNAVPVSQPRGKRKSPSTENDAIVRGPKRQLTEHAINEIHENMIQPSMKGPVGFATYPTNSVLGNKRSAAMQGEERKDKHRKLDSDQETMDADVELAGGAARVEELTSASDRGELPSRSSSSRKRSVTGSTVPTPPAPSSPIPTPPAPSSPIASSPVPALQAPISPTPTPSASSPPGSLQSSLPQPSPSPLTTPSQIPSPPTTSLSTPSQPAPSQSTPANSGPQQVVTPPSSEIAISDRNVIIPRTENLLEELRLRDTLRSKIKYFEPRLNTLKVSEGRLVRMFEKCSNRTGYRGTTKKLKFSDYVSEYELTHRIYYGYLRAEIDSQKEKIDASSAEMKQDLDHLSESSAYMRLRVVEDAGAIRKSMERRYQNLAVVSQKLNHAEAGTFCKNFSIGSKYSSSDQAFWLEDAESAAQCFREMPEKLESIYGDWFNLLTAQNKLSSGSSPGDVLKQLDSLIPQFGKGKTFAKSVGLTYEYLDCLKTLDPVKRLNLSSAELEGIIGKVEALRLSIKDQIVLYKTRIDKLSGARNTMSQSMTKFRENSKSGGASFKHALNAEPAETSRIQTKSNSTAAVQVKQVPQPQQQSESWASRTNTAAGIKASQSQSRPQDLPKVNHTPISLPGPSTSLPPIPPSHHLSAKPSWLVAGTSGDTLITDGQPISPQKRDGNDDSEPFANKAGMAQSTAADNI